MKSQVFRAIVAVLMLGVVAGACGSGSDQDTATGKTFPTTNAPAPAIVELNALLDDDGVLTVPAAQRLFAAYVAPLAGVEPLVLPEPTPDGIGTLATRRLSPGAPGVTPEIRGNVDAALATVGGETVEIVPGGPGKSRVADAPTAAELRSKVLAIRDRLQEFSGYRLTNPIRVRIVADRVTGGDAWSDTVGPPSSTAPCQITIPESVADGSAMAGETASVTSTLAHEVWHCFQLSASPGSWAASPAWIIEGQAEYAGEAYVGGSGSAQAPWDTWLETPPASLFRRSYDAIGIYALADARGVDVWRAMLPMLGRGSVAALEGLFGAASDEIMRADAQSLVRNPAYGPEWETTGPGVTGARASAELSINEGAPAEALIPVARYSGLPFEITHGDGDVLTVQIIGGVGGRVAFPGAGTVELGPGGTAKFCMRDEPCVCPDGSNPGGGIELPRITGDRGVAAVGATAAGQAGLRGQIVSLEAACQRLVGEWETDVAQVSVAIGNVFGGFPVRCTGPYRLTFGADGSFGLTFRAVCRGDQPGLVGEGTGTFTGTYVAGETTVDLAGIAGTSELRFNGMPVGGELFRPTEGRAEYSIAGDQLTWGWPIPGRAPVTFTLLRVT